MHMYEKNWAEAQIDFFESFRSYDEAGSPQRITVLKYLVLSNMLMKSEINPFDSQETKPYKNDPQITSMTSLVEAYQRDDISGFEKILRENRADIMDDKFIAQYISDILTNIRTAVLLKLIGPYKRIALSYIAAELAISNDEVEDLTISLILDGKIRGKLDAVEGRLDMISDTEGSRFDVMGGLADSIDSLWQGSLQKIAVN